MKNFKLIFLIKFNNLYLSKNSNINLLSFSEKIEDAIIFENSKKLDDLLQKYSFLTKKAFVQNELLSHLEFSNKVDEDFWKEK